MSAILQIAAAILAPIGVWLVLKFLRPYLQKWQTDEDQKKNQEIEGKLKEPKLVTPEEREDAFKK